MIIKRGGENGDHMVENGMDIDRQRIGINMITIGMNITVMFRHLEEVIFQEEV